MCIIVALPSRAVRGGSLTSLTRAFCSQHCALCSFQRMRDSRGLLGFCGGGGEEKGEKSHCFENWRERWTWAVRWWSRKEDSWAHLRGSTIRREVVTRLFVLRKISATFATRILMCVILIKWFLLRMMYFRTNIFRKFNYIDKCK